jgi:hypothetical protein
MSKSKPKYDTVSVVAAARGCHRTTIYWLALRGGLKRKKVRGKRLWLYEMPSFNQ